MPERDQLFIERLRARAKGISAPSSSYCLKAGSIVRVKSRNWRRCIDRTETGQNTRITVATGDGESLGRRDGARGWAHQVPRVFRDGASALLGQETDPHREVFGRERRSRVERDQQVPQLLGDFELCTALTSVHWSARQKDRRPRPSRTFDRTHADSFVLQSWHSRTQRCRLSGTFPASRVVSGGRRPAPFVAPTNPPCPSAPYTVISSEFLAPVVINEPPGRGRDKTAGNGPDCLPCLDPFPLREPPHRRRFREPREGEHDHF